VWDETTSATVLNLITGLPHGVEAMSNEIAGLVETSTNLAVVEEKDGKLNILMSTRSSVASALEALRRRIRATATLAAAQVTEKAGYPGWQPDVNSHLLEVLKKLHLQVMGSEPEVGAVHAGLECGIIGEKFPGMDMISFGPQIEFPHSPDGRVKVDTVGRFYNLLTAMLKNLAQG
jgi:dipeptidase D